MPPRVHGPSAASAHTVPQPLGDPVFAVRIAVDPLGDPAIAVRTASDPLGDLGGAT